MVTGSLSQSVVLLVRFVGSEAVPFLVYACELTVDSVAFLLGLSPLLVLWLRRTCGQCCHLIPDPLIDPFASLSHGAGTDLGPVRFYWSILPIYLWLGGEKGMVGRKAGAFAWVVGWFH